MVLYKYKTKFILRKEAQEIHFRKQSFTVVFLTFPDIGLLVVGEVT